jgi:hypothetical protein
MPHLQKKTIFSLTSSIETNLPSTTIQMPKIVFHPIGCNSATLLFGNPFAYREITPFY